jgi:hypothetical protein
MLAIGSFLQGCSALGLTQDAASSPTEPTIEYRTKTVTVEVPSDDEATTVRLIQVLDAAGCDFAGVQITEGTNRKNSSTLTVGCK